MNEETRSLWRDSTSPDEDKVVYEFENDKVLYTYKGEKYCDEELALSVLLKNEVLFCNCRHYSMKKDGESDGETIVLFVICNDIFAWALADGEDLLTTEIENLYRMYKKDPTWGPAKWCCYRRNEKPQHPVAEAMKKDGSWDESMDKLRDNHYDEACKRIFASKSLTDNPQ